MNMIMLKSKIHKAVVTGCELDYEGSIEIDEDLIDAASLLPYEQVQIYNINNGARFTTYVIKGERGSGVIRLNGAAARLAYRGDLVIITSYVIMDKEEVKGFSPIVVMVDKGNKAV